MRIALFHNLPSGGAKRAVHEWVRRLVTSHRLDVYTLDGADHAFCDIRPLVEEHHVFQFDPHHLFEHPWGRLNQLQRWRDLGRLTRLGRSIAREINARNYDVVFAHPCSYTLIPVFLRFLQIPVVYYLHEPFGPAFVREFQRPYLRNRTRWIQVLNHLDPLPALYKRRLEKVRRRSIRRTTRLLANSQFTRRQMRLQYDLDTPICRYGVNLSDFHPMNGLPERNRVLSVGELTPRKGFDFLVESLARLPSDKRPALRLASNWVNPAERLYVEQLAVRNEVELQVLTNLDTDQLALEYNNAQLCLYAPVSEPFGLVPLESMACSTPVVGVREAGVCETVLHGVTGLLIERNPHEFAVAVSSLLEDEERRKSYGEQGRLYVESEWSWDRSAHCVERHLAAVIKDKPRTRVWQPG